MQGSVSYNSISYDTCLSVDRTFWETFRSLVLVCSGLERQQDAEAWSTSTFYDAKQVPRVEPGSADDVELLREVRCYLWHQEYRCSIPAKLQQAWNTFYQRYSRLVRHSVLRSLPRSVAVNKLDDLVQESWALILRAICRGGYDPARGRVSAWLAELARRTARSLARRGAWWESRSRVSITEVESLLTSHHLTPDEASAMAEFSERLPGKLAAIRQHNTPENYQIFCRRFLEIGRAHV